MKNKCFRITFAIILTLVTFAGCSSISKPSPKSPVTIHMWHNYGGEMQSTMDALIDEFNSTVGKEQGIIVNVTAISSGASLSESLDLILNDDPGAPKMPDIFTGYPKIAVKFQEKGQLANLDKYFTKTELDKYVPEFVNEGRLSDGGLYVFPIAKSTEILYLNKTLFDRFAKETGAKQEELSTFEGIARLSESYYVWTDAKTPDISNDGKAFFTADSWFNIVQVGLKQYGKSIFDEKNNISVGSEEYRHIFHTFFAPAVSGGIALYNGYSSDLSKTGDLVCSTGSSAGIMFYGDTVTYSNNVTEPVEYSIMPYPTFENGEKTAVQRGGGLMVTKNDEKKEYAASAFIKWITAPAQNMRFISSTGYLPVTKQAFEKDMPESISSISDTRIKKMLDAVGLMYKDYSFFTAPTFPEFDEISKNYEKKFKETLTVQHENKINGNEISEADAIALIR